MRRTLSLLFLAGLLTVAVFALPLLSGAEPLPDNCTRTQGTVNCTTFEGPGNNQAGVGTTTETQTQGNTTNFSPAPQEPGTSTSCNPSTSNGKPCNP
jgi:hypothetical protein